MRPTRNAQRGAILLTELMVSVALLTGVLAAGMRTVVTARHLSERDAAMTQLFAAAQTQVARLGAADWGTLAEGERALTPAELTDLGLKVLPGLTGTVTVRAVPGLDLREIVVRLERPVTSGSAKAELATWRGKGMP